jgi:hypothetical protein
MLPMDQEELLEEAHGLLTVLRCRPWLEDVGLRQLRLTGVVLLSIRSLEAVEAEDLGDEGRYWIETGLLDPMDAEHWI